MDIQGPINNREIRNAQSRTRYELLPCIHTVRLGQVSSIECVDGV
jgi:hypothetical protein